VPAHLSTENLDPMIEIIELEKELPKKRAPSYEDKTVKAHFGDLTER
jgi:hypothetical protein